MTVPTALRRHARYGPPDHYLSPPSAGMCLSVFALVEKGSEVLRSARAAGVRTYFTRHITLPVELMGVGQLRMWRAWQRVDRLQDVQSPFLPNAPQTQIVPELAPTDREAVLDKLTLSAFAGTPLELALRGAEVQGSPANIRRPRRRCGRGFR